MTSSHDVVTDDSGLDALADDWDRLWAESPNPRVPLHRVWATTWWQHFATNGRPFLRSRLNVVTIRRRGVAVALCPWLELRPVAPFGALGRLLVGLGQEDADDGGVLWTDDAALDSVVEVIAEAVGVPGTVLVLTRLADDDPLLKAIGDLPGVTLHREETEARPVVDLRDEPEPERAVARMLKRNDVRRRWRRLGEAHDAELVAHRPVAEGGLDDFLSLHDMRWATRPDRPSGLFVSPAGRRFLGDAAAGLDDLGLLRLAFVTADGQPVVGRFGFRVGDRYDGLKSGWNPAFAAFGPGHLGVGKVLEHEVGEGLRLLDMMRGGGDHKAAWATASPDVSYWTVTASGRRGEIARRASRVARAARYRTRHRTPRENP